MAKSDDDTKRFPNAIPNHFRILKNCDPNHFRIPGAAVGWHLLELEDSGFSNAFSAERPAKLVHACNLLLCDPQKNGKHGT